MANRKLEERIDELRQLRTPSSSEVGGEVLDELLLRALTDKSNLVVAEAAKVIAQHHRKTMIPELLSALARLYENPTKTDAKCWGKTAIVQALTALDHDDSTPFLHALGHIQMEAVWGGKEDAAIHLRANAALALVQCVDLTRPAKFRHLIDALADPAGTVRIEAVRAIKDSAELAARIAAARAQHQQ